LPKPGQSNDKRVNIILKKYISTKDKKLPSNKKGKPVLNFGGRVRKDKRGLLLKNSLKEKASTI